MQQRIVIISKASSPDASPRTLSSLCLPPTCDNFQGRRTTNTSLNANEQQPRANSVIKLKLHVTLPMPGPELASRVSSPASSAFDPAFQQTQQKFLQTSAPQNSALSPQPATNSKLNKSSLKLKKLLQMAQLLSTSGAELTKRRRRNYRKL